MSVTLFWDRERTPAEIASALRELGKEFPFSEEEGGRQIIFRKGDSLRTEIGEKEIVVTYDTTASALRGAGLALAGIGVSGERCSFRKFGVMLDSSRNAVMTLECARSLLRKLALCGYNMAMLYTEDTYLLPDEPHFGAIRGGFSYEEIRQLDDCAAKLGIQLVGCIQTLGHLQTFLRSAGATPVRDTAEVLLAEEDATYELIRKMLSFWSRACRSRTIHIGMDETHNLGRGKYLDKHGWKSGFELFNRHLRKVCELCRAENLKPMLWSDMYFRMGSRTGSYYDPDSVIPQEIKDGIPQEASLVYWDYYHQKEDLYDRMIRAHRNLGREPIVASGLWTWYRLLYDHRYTVERVHPCLKSCRKNRIGDFFFTLWEDDGAYCGLETVFAALIWGADQAYSGSGEDAEKLESFSAALGCRSWKQAVAASEMNYSSPRRDNGAGTLSILLWDDPILGIGWRHLELDDETIRMEMASALRRGLAGLTEYPYEKAVGEFLLAKLLLRRNLLDSWHKKDAEALHRIRMEELPQVLEKLTVLMREFRRQWTAHYRFNGMETIQIRLGGQFARFQELAARLEELEKMPNAVFPELDIRPDRRCSPVQERYQDFAVSGIL